MKIRAQKKMKRSSESAGLPSRSQLAAEENAAMLTTEDEEAAANAAFSPMSVESANSPATWR